jgi:hypothetical protein
MAKFAKFAKILHASPFNKYLSNETTFSLTISLDSTFTDDVTVCSPPRSLPSCETE